MKLTLDQLKVDSYANQISESELTEVKGGTSPACVVYGVIAVVGLAAGYYWGSSSSSESSSTVSGTCPHGYEMEVSCEAESQSTQE